MKIAAGFEDFEETLQTFEEFTHRCDVVLRDAVEYILVQMMNYVKLYGPWKDRTTNLRNSIQYMMDSDGSPAGTLIAGTDYAIHVENKAGYWVLSGAIDYFEPMIEEIFADKIVIVRGEMDD